ncbi:sensor histidine kinase [Paludibaculum fermentans]|uniref:histidine kinase n=1 Tax=Paludibaculum fermentans TaxID=1473598 RepID=A0A7S7NKZ2_PALFE|nr:ATP-binding protein [Paludibaculum fermentans]QOY85556.1 histidine kinase [Paludibaculum fermentans]
MPEETYEPATIADLMQSPLFQDESTEAVAWIAQQMHIRRLAAGEVLWNQGDVVTEFQLVLEGELHYRRDDDPYAQFIVGTAGHPTGVLPFSRMKQATGRVWAVVPTRLAAMESSHLRELVYRAPLVAQRLVSQMTDRTREITRMEEGSSRLLALGKLAAGLAHELNNPASAAVRSSALLRDVLKERRKAAVALHGVVIPPGARESMSGMIESIEECVSTPGDIDALERADLESDMSDWLDHAGLPSSLASALVEARITLEELKPLSAALPLDPLANFLKLIVADHQTLCLTRELEEASRRISDLVQAVKLYSYMDQSPVSEVDVEQGIDLTLRMFQHQLKHGFTVNRNLSGQLPKVRANGSALNQIWTNLIDNAIDAMDAMGAMPAGQPKVLTVRTCLEPEGILVEVGDNGPGIPPEVRSRIFDPFFTTKGVGEGTGLGLDIVRRIVRSHKGTILVDSEPGRTVFQVRLPLNAA